MKKIILLFLAVLIAGTAFAQVDAKVYGALNTTFGVSMDLDDSNANSWIFGWDDAIIGVTVDTEKAGGLVQLNGGNIHKLDISAKLDPVVLSVGFGWLPWVQFSSIDFYADNNYDFGASGIKEQYIQCKYAGDGLVIYGGLARAGVGGEIMKDNAVFPGFYIGGDLEQETFSIGAAFAGVPRGKNWEAYGEDRFSWLGDLHAKFSFDPLSLGINVALHGDPEVGFNSGISMSSFYGVLSANPTKDMVLEAMLDLGVGLDPCNIGFSAAALMNFADKDDDGGAMVLRLGLNAAFDIAGGFMLIPGLFFTTPISDPGGDSSDGKGYMDIGISFQYSF